jgi:cell division protein ZipA
MGLRWGLLMVGLVLLALIYIYSRYRQEIDSFFAAIARPRAPVESTASETAAVLSPIDPELDELDTTAPAVEKAPAPEIIVKKIVAIRMMSSTDRGFSAEKLILALREAGLRHGKFGIFHRISVNDEEISDFSVASLIEPGSFDLTRVKTDFYPGVSIFLRLPGPENALDAFDAMVQISKSLATKLDAELLDEQGSTLSIQRERYMREEVIQFQHQAK